MKRLIYFLAVIFLLLALVHQPQAQPADRALAAPEITNPAIRKILDVRISRLSQLVDLKTKEYIGENNKGEVQIINLKSIPSAKKQSVIDLVEIENMDRRKMFMLLLQAKGLDQGQMLSIRQDYAKALREEAVPGEWIQMPDNLWQKKE